MESIDILIIGAGVVGLAVARELASAGRSVLVVERHDSFGRETSSRNSEVIHGGMYYPKDSLKARLCVEGRRLLYELCRECKIPFKKTGKLIVAMDKDEQGALDVLYKQGTENGVENLSLVDALSLRRMEPHVEGMSALFSAETGIIDSHSFMKCLLSRGESEGALFVFNSAVSAIERGRDGYMVTVKNGRQEERLKARVVINAAGLDSDSVAEMAGFDTGKCQYKLSYCKGQYFRVNGERSRCLNRLVYPVPRPKSGGLGIHATLDLAGGMRLGPDDAYLTNRLQDYSVDEGRRKDFYTSVKRFIPELQEDGLYPDTAGIRPKLQGPGEAFRDFVIQEESDKGFPGFINLIGIESPGLTASLAIGQNVKDLVKSIAF